MIHQEYKWKSYDGIMLYAQSWTPDSRPLAVINFIHGFKDHSGRFKKWAERFAENGFAVMAVDLRGHGHSEGKRGYARKYNDFLADIEVLITHSRESYPDLNHILYGHSMGGNLVANYLINSKILPEAAIIASPWFTLTVPPAWYKIFMAQILRLILPTITVASDLDVHALSRDPEVADNYKKDPLVHNLIRPKLFMEIEINGQKASRSIYKINVPLLVMHGTSDNITSFKQTRSFVMNAGAGTIFREWPGGYHELHNEINEKEIFECVLNWLQSCITTLPTLAH